jgi:hypothetical protein
MKRHFQKAKPIFRLLTAFLLSKIPTVHLYETFKPEPSAQDIFQLFAS